MADNGTVPESDKTTVSDSDLGDLNLMLRRLSELSLSDKQRVMVVKNQDRLAAIFRRGTG